jgi:2-oxoglutarate ferredoxin oxidoreductase subunit alpha
LVAWGSSQGVVREAVSLCRSFGLKVAALYPKLLWPVPAQDLSRFAETVKKLVVVEPNPSGYYTQLIQSHTHLRPSSILPDPEEELSPMDIFLREDLGGGC